MAEPSTRSSYISSTTITVLIVKVASLAHLSIIHPLADDVFSLCEVRLGAGLLARTAIERMTGLEISIHLLVEVEVVIALVAPTLVVVRSLIPLIVKPILLCTNSMIELVKFVEIESAAAINICLLEVVFEHVRIVVLS